MPYTQIGRPVFLNTGGIDGRQARLRREIDRLKACSARYQDLIQKAELGSLDHGTPLPSSYEGWQYHVATYESKIKL